MPFKPIIKAPITAVWAIAKIYGKSWQWTASTGAAVAVLLVLVGTCVGLALPNFARLQTLTDNLNRVTRENLTGLPVVRAYNAESYQESKFEEANSDFTRTNLYTSRVLAMMMPGITLVMNGLSLAICWIGAYLIDGADMAGKMGYFSDMVVFSSYTMQVIMAFMMLVMIFIILPRASVSAKRYCSPARSNPTWRMATMGNPAAGTTM